MKSRRPHLTEAQRNDLARRHHLGESPDKLAKEFSVDKTTVMYHSRRRKLKALSEALGEPSDARTLSSRVLHSQLSATDKVTILKHLEM